MSIIIVFLVLWLLLSVLGFVVKGLLWLAILSLIFFVATGIYGAIVHRR